MVLVFCPVFLVQVARAQPSAAFSHYHRGESLYERNALAEALKEFERAYAIDPQPHRGERVGMHFEDYDPEFQMGRIQARLGRFTEAKRLFDRCAARGYTERSENAEEFRRWRGIVEQAVAAVPPVPSPSPVSAAVPETVATRAPPREPSPPTPRPEGFLPPLAFGGPTVPPGGEATRRVPLQTTVLVGVATAVPAPPSAAQTTPGAVTVSAAESRFVSGTPGLRPQVTAPALSHLTSPARAVSPWGRFPSGLVLAAALLLLLFAAWRLRRRRAGGLDEGMMNFGRYSITGLLGVGRSSFVYDAKDRKTGHSVALRIRRPDSGRAEAERFTREGLALEQLKHLGAEAPVAKLAGRGIQKVSGRVFEYLALERLSGRTLLDLSRNARRRLDLMLCVEILRETAGALRRVRTLGLSYEALDLEDVFLVDPVPVNPGNAIQFKIFGLQPGSGDPNRDAAALELIATTLFRGRVARWEQDEWVAHRVPAALRQVLIRVRDNPGAPGASFDDLEKALQESTGGHSRDSLRGSSGGA